MANLTAKFKLIDEMSDRMEAIADSGHSLLSEWEQMGGTANSSFGTAASAADGVATSFNGVSNSAAEAAQATDHWTDAVGNYDKGALEAIYSTEELVEMGLKSADALAEQDEMFALCERSAEALTRSMEAATDIENELSQAQEEAAKTAEEMANADDISAEAQEALTRAQEEAAEAMEELHKAQEEATAAMENYDAVLTSGTTDLDELEAAAERAGHAAEDLAEKNERASKAAEDLTEATDRAGEELEDTGKKGADAMNELEGAIAAAGITMLLKEMAEAAYELADAFSEAEKTVVLATGATGEALEGLEKSMMNVYSTAKSADLSSTAGAVGEINTRLGLTGEKLEEVTDLFLDYSNVTGQNVVSSVQNVTKVMNQWGVELDGLPGLLDELTYAGQISGINVGNLSDTLVTNKGVLQSLGFTLEDSIGLFAQLELQGVSAQTAMTGFRTALNKFADEGQDAETALQGLIDKIVNAGSESEATSIAVDYFGSRAGAALASSIRSGTLSIEDLTATLNGAQGALNTTATASQTLSEKWQKAGNNMKTAFTNALQPTLDKASSALAGIMDRVAGFLKDHPKVVKAVTAIAVGVGIFVAGIVAYTVATKAAAIAQAALNAVMDANPIFLIATAVTAATVALVGFIAAIAETRDYTKNLTPALQEQREEIDRLQSEYDDACEKFGESSYQAQELKWQIDDLTTSFEASKQTVGEYLEKHNELVSKWSENAQQRDEAAAATERESDNIFSLIGRMEELASKTDITSAEQQELLVIIGKLNEAVPGLGISYDNLTGKLSRTKEDILAIAEAQVNAQKKQVYWDNLIQAEMDKNDAIAQRTEDLAQQTAAYNALQKAQDDLANAKVYAQQKWPGATPNGAEETYRHNYLVSFENAVTDAQNTYDAFAQTISDDDAAIAKAESQIEEYSNALADVNTPALEAMETAKNTEEVINYMADALGELRESYEAAYQAAKESFDGQFGLFDEAKANMDSTVANAQAAMDSQLKYWDTYLNNVNVLKDTSAADLGITQENYNALMQYVQDGSAEAAGLAQSMVDAIESGNSDAVTKLANTVGEVQAKRDEAAGAVAEWQIDFNGKMDEIVEKAQKTVNEMNMSSEAEAAASATINAYADAILAQGARAIANAKSIAAQVHAALSSTGTPPVVGKYTTGGYAEGTDYATPGAHLVGENGPEIVEFRGGEKVYNNEETECIMARSAAVKFFSSPEGGTAIQENAKTDPKDNTKTIRLEINGGGAIEVNGSMDESAVVEILQANLKPVLTSIVKQEIYEEGERSYDF